MTENEIQQSISIFVSSYADGAITDLAGVEKRVKALIDANPALAKSIGDVKKISEQTAREYMRNMSQMSRSSQQFDDSLAKIQYTAARAMRPLSQLAGLVGAGLGFTASFHTVTKFNNALAGLGISFRKYGTDVTTVENSLRGLSKQTGLTLETTADFMKMYDKGFNFNSLENASKLLKNIQKVVGSDTDAIRQMTGELSAFAKQFPDLERSMTNLTGVDRKRIDSQTRLLYLTGKINQEQYKSVQDYLKGSSQLTAADQRRQTELQSQEKSIQEMKRAFESLALTIGKQLAPLFQGISDFINKHPQLFKAAAIVGMAAPVAVPAARQFGGKALSTGGSLIKSLGGMFGDKSGVGSILSKVGGATESIGYAARKATAQDVFVVGGKLDSIGGGSGGLPSLSNIKSILTGGGGAAGGTGTVAATTGTYGLAGEGTAATAAGGFSLAGAATATGLGLLAAAIGTVVGSVINKARGIDFADQAKAAKGVFAHPLDTASAVSNYGFFESSQNKNMASAYNQLNAGAGEAYNRNRHDQAQDNAYNSAYSSGNIGANIAATQRQLEVEDKKNKYAERRARLEQVTQMRSSGKDKLGNALAPDVANRLKIEEEALTKDLSKLDQGRADLQGRLDGLQKAQIDKGAVYKAQLASTNDLLAQQQANLQAITSQLGALGPVGAKGMAQFDQQAQSTFQSMQKIAALQAQQAQQVEQEQQTLKANNAKARGDILNDKTLSPADRQAQLQKLDTSDTSADLQIESGKQQMEAQRRGLTGAYANMVSAKADLNRPEIERQEARSGALKSQVEMSGTAGNVRGFISGQSQLINISRIQQENVRNSLKGVEASIKSEQVASDQAKTEDERQMHTAAINELTKRQNQLRSEGLKFAKEERDNTVAISQAYEKLVQQAQARLEFQKATAEFAAAGGDIAGAMGAGKEAILTTQAQAAMQGRNLSNLNAAAGAAQQEAQTATSPEAYEQAIAKVRDIDVKRSQVKTELVRLSQQEVQQSKDLANSNSGVLNLQQAKLSRMEAELNLMNSLGAGLSASVEQRNKVLEQMKGIETEQRRALQTIDDQQAAQQRVVDDQNASAEQRKTAANALFQLETARQQKNVEILQTQQKQAELMKSLRDGYINAISAMTAGSGMITKIMIDQNKNMGIGMEQLGMLQARTLGGRGSIGGGGSGLRGVSRMGIGGLVAPDQTTAANQTPNFYNKAGHIMGNVGDNRDRLLDSINRGSRSSGAYAGGTAGGRAGIGAAVNGGSQANFNTPGPAGYGNPAPATPLASDPHRPNTNPFGGNSSNIVTVDTKGSSTTINVNVQLDTSKTGDWSKEIDKALKKALSGTGLLTGSNFRT